MTLLPDWKSILTKAWSVKFLVLAGGVAAAEAVVQLAGVQFLPPGVAPAVTGLLSALGILARVLAQKEAEEVASDRP